MPKQNRQAMQAELREFLSQMRGKSPKEMLGTIASSNLLQSTVAATAATVAAIVVLTLVPFGIGKLSGGSDRVAGPPAEAVEEPGAALAPPPEPQIDGVAQPDAIKTLGIGESESAPENVNPLEPATDDLLEGLE